ncbi:MAG: class I SAM-dependent methyltransferase [Tannerellaceae bacterium]|jgi:SAM-dependent methyltransferase|nr:class I SAM-dependent methyltransferase [Tannerellaceae bacterium]
MKEGLSSPKEGLNSMKKGLELPERMPDVKTKIKEAMSYDLDDARRTLVHKDIILGKAFLKKLYTVWYRYLAERVALIPGKYLEIGSGGGFLKEVFPEVITSDILPLDTVDIVCNAEKLPFDDNTLQGIMMLNVFHHIPRPYLFLEEAGRTLLSGGKIVMIEPANSHFSRFIYTHFHHEAFDPEGAMEIRQGNPLSNANQALPYIYFVRDEREFNRHYPTLRIKIIKHHTPFLYILSGGLSKPSLLPGCFFGIARFVEKLFKPFYRQLGLFYFIEIEKQDLP